jgi:hypothetical protein
VRQIVLPDDPLPEADAIVAVGHPLNYLPDAEAVNRALIAMAAALRPGGLLAFDICDLEWGRLRRDAPAFASTGPDWAIITQFSVPVPDRFIRDITTFLPNSDGPLPTSSMRTSAGSSQAASSRGTSGHSRW